MKKSSWWYLKRHPLHFQGDRKNANYFEGWYFKVVDPESNLAFALIPGIAHDNKVSSHSFIQLLNGAKKESYYFEFSRGQFDAKAGTLNVRIGDNQFTKRQMKLNLPKIKADLRFGQFNELKTSLGFPGIMGWYSYVPFMQCYHGLGSMHHSVSGQVELDGQQYELKNACGYLEKDWGISFPKSWIWMQCNTFKKTRDFSVFASVAHIPWLSGYFIGFIAAVLYQGDILIFSTYNHADRSTIITETGVEIKLKRKNYHLQIVAHQQAGTELKSPVSGDMVGKVNESMLATMEVKLQSGNTVLVDDMGIYSGLELAGEVEMLEC